MTFRLHYWAAAYRRACGVGYQSHAQIEIKIIYFALVGTYRIHGQSVIHRVIEAGLKAGYRAFGEYNRHTLSLILHT
jgi:hypothetical protein